MHFQTRLDRSLAMLADRGLPRRHIEPLPFRLLWKLGVNIRPPHFLGFAHIAIAFGTCFAGTWGVFMWCVVWSRMGKSLAAAGLMAAAVGACFGLMMAWFYTRERKELALPAWETIGQDERAG
jgi:hypothetical protein